MNSLLLKILPTARKLMMVGSGLIKPLPLSGIIKEVGQLRAEKLQVAKVIRLLFYITTGLVLWALILGKITADDAIRLIQALQN